MIQKKQCRAGLLAAAVFWLAVWQAAAMAIGQEVFLVSPIQAAGTLMELLPQADFWQRVGFSAGHILLGFALGVVVSVLLAAAAGQGHAGGQLHHSGAGVGQRAVALHPHQLSDGPARAVQCRAHRH